jgi:hypothetical protein
MTREFVGNEELRPHPSTPDLLNQSAFFAGSSDDSCGTFKFEKHCCKRQAQLQFSLPMWWTPIGRVSLAHLPPSSLTTFSLLANLSSGARFQLPKLPDHGILELKGKVGTIHPSFEQYERVSPQPDIVPRGVPLQTLDAFWSYWGGWKSGVQDLTSNHP